MDRNTFNILEKIIETQEKDVDNLAGLISIVITLSERVDKLEKEFKEFKGTKLVPYEGLVPHG